MSSGVNRAKSFKDKISDYRGAVKTQIDRTKSIFTEARQDEPVMKANLVATQMLIDLRQRSRDYRLAIDHLANEYTAGKESTLLTRYGKMKTTVKSILMQERQLSKLAHAPTPMAQLELNTTSIEITMPANVNSGDKDIQAKLKMFESMSRQDVLDDTKRLEDEAEMINARLSSVRLAIQRLEEEYLDAKRFPPWYRYTLMKDMIKRFLTCRQTLSNI